MNDLAQRFAHLVSAEDASDAAVVRLDRDGSIRSANRAAERLFGQPLAAMVARPLAVFFPDLDSEGGPLERVLTGERLERLRLGLEHSPWFTIPVSMTLVPLRHDGGPIVGCTVVVWDLTEQVFSQQTLAASEELVRRSEALAGIGRFVVDTRDGSTQWSEGMHAIHGTSPDGFDVSLASHLALVHPDRRACVADAFESALLGQATAELDHRILRPDGRVSWVFLAVEPRRDAAGRLVGLSGICQDVTARTEVETALQKSVEQLTQSSRLAALLTEITAHANEAVDVPDAMRKALASVCAYTGWPVGHALVLSPDMPHTLISLGVWHLAEPSRFSEFRKAIEQDRYTIGEGLPGRTLELGEPIWIPDLSADDSVRLRGANAYGLAAAFALPIRVQADTVGVLEFFGGTVQEADETLLRLSSIVGVQLGRVFEREGGRAASYPTGAL